MTCDAACVDRRAGEATESDALSAEDRGLWFGEGGDRQLRELLYWRWDPIGVNHAFPNTRDEYDRYAGTLGGLLVRGASPVEIEKALLAAEEAMGLAAKPGAEERRRRTSAQILDWLEDSIFVWREHAGDQARTRRTEDLA